jgi:hypothetical protein
MARRGAFRDPRICGMKRTKFLLCGHIDGSNEISPLFAVSAWSAMGAVSIGVSRMAPEWRKRVTRYEARVSDDETTIPRNLQMDMPITSDLPDLIRPYVALIATQAARLNKLAMEVIDAYNQWKNNPTDDADARCRIAFNDWIEQPTEDGEPIEPLQPQEIDSKSTLPPVKDVNAGLADDEYDLCRMINMCYQKFRTMDVTSEELSQFERAIWAARSIVMAKLAARIHPELME